MVGSDLYTYLSTVFELCSPVLVKYYRTLIKQEHVQCLGCVNIWHLLWAGGATAQLQARDRNSFTDTGDVYGIGHTDRMTDYGTQWTYDSDSECETD
jgi:hypothetical protein